MADHPGSHTPGNRRRANRRTTKGEKVRETELFTAQKELDMLQAALAETGGRFTAQKVFEARERRDAAQAALRRARGIGRSRRSLGRL